MINKIMIFIHNNIISFVILIIYLLTILSILCNWNSLLLTLIITFILLIFRNNIIILILRLTPNNNPYELINVDEL